MLFFDPSTVIWQSSNLFATLHIPGPMLFPFVYVKWLCFMDQLSPDPTTIDVLTGYSWWIEGSMIPLNGIQAGPSFQKDIGTVTTTTVTTVTNPRATVTTVTNPRTTLTTVATVSFDFSQCIREANNVPGAFSKAADLVLQNVVCTSLERSGQWPRHGRNNKREKSGFHQGDMMIGYDILDRMIYCINDYIQYIGYDNMMIG